MGHLLVIENAADRPDLIDSLAALRWYEMGPDLGLERRDDWVAATARESGHRLPVTFAAVNATGDVVGGVGLAEHDLAEVLPHATPWIVGMVVHPGFRRRGVGRALLARLERWAADLGSDRVWVATEREPAVPFYRSCGWTVDQAATAAAAGVQRGTVLVKIPIG
jgi:GNAT superfamily N-acetyltransferase